jgi:beta-lactamase superfamily II metal-dependent hydrolase
VTTSHTGAQFSIEALPAGRGDCFWVECELPSRTWRLLFDGGTPEAWPALEARIYSLPPADRSFDLVVVSHVDSDHIGGMLPFFAAARDLNVRICDVWFNGLQHIQDGGAGVRSVAEAQGLERLLLASRTGNDFPWNRAFQGGAVVTPGHNTIREVQLAEGPELILLSPTPTTLQRLGKVWQSTLESAVRGEPEEQAPPVASECLADLESLAAYPTKPDQSRANASSIAILLIHAGVRCLIAADSSSVVLGAALTALANHWSAPRVELDILQLPHHGSQRSAPRKLLELAPARHYLISSSGERFHHPDDVSLARVLQPPQGHRSLWFNYRTDRNLRWNDNELQRRYHFEAHYPEPGRSGISIQQGNGV